MKKTILTSFLAAVTIIGTSAFIVKSSTGIAGYSGSPGEATCSHCHGGGSSAASGITITSVPEFSMNGNSQLEYFPDSVYQIVVEVSATGFTRYGFASQVLNPNFVNSGALASAGTGVKFLNSGPKRTAVHTTPKINSAGTVTFTYKWTAPAAGEGDATIHAIANAVNGNGNTSGDFVLAPVSIVAVEGTPPEPPNTTSHKENTTLISQVSVYPNPSSGLSSISYYMRKAANISIQLIDIKGKVIRELYNQPETPGTHTQLLDLHGTASGVYFIKTSIDDQKVSQKLITVQ